jgi:hypothetical protein
MNGTVNLQSRIASIDIYVDDLPILKVMGDGREERSYALCARDGTVIAKYSSEKLFVLDELLKFYERHKDEISVSKHRQFIDYLLKQGIAVKMDITLDQLGVHLFNSRYIPTAEIEGFEQLVSLAERGRLMNEIIVTPVDSDTVKAFKYIAESAKEHGRDPMNALAGILCRRAMPKGDELVVLEDDRLYQLAMRCGWEKAEKDGRMRIKYLIVDGYIRFEAARKAFEMNIDKWRKVPTISAIVIPTPSSSAKKPTLGMDPIAVFYLSVTANSFARDVNEDLSRFVKLFQAGDVVETFGKRMRFEILEEFGGGMKAREDSELKRMSYVKQELTRIEYREPIEESVEEKRPEEEEEKREEKKWKKREEPAVKEAMRPVVSEAQRQFAPTFSYAPAQPRLSAQTTISPQAQPIREEAQPQPVQLDEISVLSAVLMKFFPKQNLDAHLYVFPGKGIDVKLDYNARKALEGSGLEGSGLARSELEIDVRYTNVNMDYRNTSITLKVLVGDERHRVSGESLRFVDVNFSKLRVHVPVVWGKYCSKCSNPIVLSPTRCVFCGEVISPLPYVVSYKPAGT